MSTGNMNRPAAYLGRQEADPLFTHYLLGRCLALEAMVREMLPIVPASSRRALACTLQDLADTHGDLARQPPEDGPTDHGKVTMHTAVRQTIARFAARL